MWSNLSSLYIKKYLNLRRVHDVDVMLPVADPAVQRGTIVSGLARLPVLISMQSSSVCEDVLGLGSVNEY